MTVVSPTHPLPPPLRPSRMLIAHERSHSPPLEKSRIFVTGDSDQYYTVDITGFRTALFIKELIFSKLRIEDEEQTRYSIYRTDVGSYALGEALSDEQLYELCRDNGDSKCSLKFLVANSSAVVHERNHSSPAASPTVSSMQPPVVYHPVTQCTIVLIPDSALIPGMGAYLLLANAPSNERPRHFRFDDPNGADAESYRSTLRPSPKPYGSNQNLVPSSRKFLGNRPSPQWVSCSIQHARSFALFVSWSTQF
ncbi:hypothetical protein BJV77DRAFT_25893 [Russula vinacea]|nr:hypothetical protein BJV77DRAFT_25893 [Russula vinacea]